MIDNTLWQHDPIDNIYVKFINNTYTHLSVMMWKQDGIIKVFYRVHQSEDQPVNHRFKEFDTEAEAEKYALTQLT